MVYEAKNNFEVDVLDVYILLGELGIFQSYKYHSDLLTCFLVFHEFFLVVIEYLVCFFVLLEEGGVGVGEELMNGVGKGDGSRNVIFLMEEDCVVVIPKVCDLPNVVAINQILGREIVECFLCFFCWGGGVKDIVGYAILAKKLPLVSW